MEKLIIKNYKLKEKIKILKGKIENCENCEMIRKHLGDQQQRTIKFYQDKIKDLEGRIERLQICPPSIIREYQDKIKELEEKLQIYENL